MKKPSTLFKTLRVAGVVAAAALCVVGCMCGCTVHVSTTTTTSASSSASSSSSGSSTVISKSYSFDQSVSTINIDLRAGDVALVKGDTLSVECSIPEQYQPSVSCNGSTLSITQEGFDNVSVNGTWTVTITVPESCDLQSIDVDLDLGTFSMTGLDCYKADVETDLGNVVLDNCTINVGELSTDMGDIKTTDTTLVSGKVKTDLGDITLDGNYDNVDWECEMGQVTVNGKAYN